MTNLTMWNPLREFDALTNRLFGNDALLRGTASGRPWSPSVDITEDDEAYRIVADLPDVPKDAVKVTVENGVLSIRGERRWETKTDTTKTHLIERSYGSFSRSFRLPDDASGEVVSATFKDGVLTVELPKREEAKPKEIEVKIN
ncbi:MAG: Hsp20/alpha crystallin family protein [Verrucomicrobiales bacterium]